MVDVSLLQSLSYIAAAIGVCVAAYYYVSMIRNNEMIRRRDMVFQKLSLDHYKFYDLLYDIARMTDWETLEEFQRKYSYWVNPEAWKKFIYVMNYYNCVGILLRDGIVDASQVFQLYSAGFLIRLCNTFKPWLDTQGISDNYFSGVKYMYAEALKFDPGSKDNRLTRGIDDVLQLTKWRMDAIKSSKN